MSPLCVPIVKHPLPPVTAVSYAREGLKVSWPVPRSKGSDANRNIPEYRGRKTIRCPRNIVEYGDLHSSKASSIKGRERRYSLIVSASASVVKPIIKY